MRVLVIDDEPLVRRSLSRALKAKGHLVLEAADGIEGESVWRQERPDVVFVDVLMPGLTGPQLLKKMEGHQSRIILMSAYSGEHNIETAESAGADLFINKPFEDIFSIVAMAETLIEEMPL